MEIVITVSVAACGGFVIRKIVSHFLNPAKSAILRALPFFIFALTITNKSWIGDENPLILFPFFILVFIIGYQGTWYSRLITGGIFFSLLEPLCMMIDTLSQQLSHGYAQNLLPNFGKLALCILLWLLVRRIAPKNSLIFLPKQLWGLLGGLTLAPLFTTLSFTIWNARIFNFKLYQIIVTPMGYTILPFVMLSAMAILVAMLVLSRHEELVQRQKLAEIQQVYYQSLQREQTAVRTLRHDLHNHVVTAQGLLENGDILGAQRYLDELFHSPGLTGGKHYCENSVANAVLSSKVLLIESKGIEWSMEVSLSDRLAFPAVDLCALLGNALDNAIEAAEKAEDKKISLHIRADKGMLMLRVENTFAQPPKQENGLLITSKQNQNSHGYGFAALKEIARRHGGICEAEYSGEKFSLLASIPLGH